MRKQPQARIIEDLVAWVELADGNEYAVPRVIGFGARGQAIRAAADAMQQDSVKHADEFAVACLSVFYPDDAQALVDCQAVGVDAFTAIVQAVSGGAKKKYSGESLTEQTGV